MRTLPNGLPEDVLKIREGISVDSLTMTLGELEALQKGGDLVFDVESLRGHNWGTLKVARLVEAILAGMPLPAVLVRQTEIGKWEVVKNAGFLSEILLFMRETGKGSAYPLPLSCATYLPHLKGKVWREDEGAENELSLAERLLILRAPVQVNILCDPENKINDELLFFWK